MLGIHEDKQKILDRIQPRIQHISDLLHYYMISPKDAFRKVPHPPLSGTTPEPDTSTSNNFTK